MLVSHIYGMCSLDFQCRGPREIVRTAALALGVMLIVLSANEYVLKLFRLVSDPSNPVWFDRDRCAL